MKMMGDPKATITDVTCIGIEKSARVLKVLSENDQLLRRFGQVDFIQLVEQGEGFEIYRKEADEVWVVVEGQARFNLLDRREDSPTQNIQNIIDLSADDPLALLVPFGVRCRVSSIVGGKLIRITTHEDETLAGDLTP